MSSENLFVRDEPWSAEEASFRRITFGTNNLIVTCSDLGATVASVLHHGVELTLNFDKISDFPKSRYFGATVGRVGNRIGQGKFSLDGKAYTLAVNNGPNHLHGGLVGYDKVKWDSYEIISNPHEKGVAFRRRSPNGEEGYPGTLDVTVTYTVDTRAHAGEDGLLRMKFHAAIVEEGDAPTATPCNIINHNYWNLAGWQSGAATTILDHTLQLQSDYFSERDDFTLSTGQILSVAKQVPEALDLRTARRLGDGIRAIIAAEPEKGEANGYDHCFVVRGQKGQLRPVGVLSDPKSGRIMRIQSTYPAVQVYSSSYLTESVGKGGCKYGQYSAVCLECQHIPDSINHSHFPSVVVRPGQPFDESAEYAFSLKK